MLQFYFLSIFLNLLIGVALIYSNSEKLTLVNDQIFQLVIGILSVFVGLIKLLSAVRGIPFLGDLLPAIANFLGGGALLVNYYIEKSNDELTLPDFVQLIFIDKKKYIGIGCVVIAIIHFIAPDVLFL